MRDYARLGAAVRLRQLDAERREIHRAFPDLQRRKSANGDAAVQGPRKRTWKLSAAQRKAISERMRKTWAARRSAPERS
jgi:hypothetical protein